MAALTDYQAYHNYVVGAVAGFTAAGKSVFIAGETDAAGIPLTEVKLEHIENYTNQATKDSLLFDLLRQMERFEQTSSTLTVGADLDPIREFPYPTSTPTTL